jgi:ABC-2 type transport system permease protein
MVNGKQQRIVIAGDADFLSNAELARKTSNNFEFNTALFSWFTYGKFPVDTSRPKSKDNSLDITSAQLAKLKIIYLGNTSRNNTNVRRYIFSEAQKEIMHRWIK